ncbi:hypothetical protein P7K49_018925 [Saguinus oedipus]|uniref:Uncharacterized protein n=1 Tax=Saguinus oedipus TaxID=9490 RepID=A0ABQ9UWU1_SAGOE|nr:hypothetical protein P7K49_018925 [Saguinus oedipus]
MEPLPAFRTKAAFRCPSLGNRRLSGAQAALRKEQKQIKHWGLTSHHAPFSHRVNVERLDPLGRQDLLGLLVLMASLGPRVSKERPARKVMLAPLVLRAPLEHQGLR